MIKLPSRKFILLCLVAVLSVIYICQLLFTGKSQVKMVAIEGEITSIELESSSSKVDLTLKDGQWFVSKYKADKNEAESLVNAVKEIKILGTVSSNGSSDSERYGLSESSCIKVSAKNGDKILRSLVVGKNTGTNSQSYIQLDGKNSVHLVQGALNSVFAKSIDSLRDKSILSLDTTGILSVKCENPDGNVFGVSKNAPSMNEENPKVWNLAENSTGLMAELDDSKVSSWVNSFGQLRVTQWLSDDASFDYDNAVKFIVSTSTSTVTVEIVKDENDAFVTTSQSDYIAKISTSVAEKFLKTVSDLSK